MRRIGVLALVAVLTASFAVAPAEAGKRKTKRTERTVTGAYSTPAPGVSGTGEFYGACMPDRQIGCVKIVPKPGELFASIQIEDAVGIPVHAFVTNEDGGIIIAEFCGESEKGLFLGSDDPFLVWAIAGACGDGGTAGAATTGTVTAVLSNLP